MKALTKEQKAAVAAQKKAQKQNQNKRALGELFTHKLGLGGTAAVLGVFDGEGIPLGAQEEGKPEPAKLAAPVIPTAVGYIGAVFTKGKVGSMLEGVGDAGAALLIAGMTRGMRDERRARIAAEEAGAPPAGPSGLPRSTVPDGVPRTRAELDEMMGRVYAQGAAEAHAQREAEAAQVAGEAYAAGAEEAWTAPGAPLV